MKRARGRKILGVVCMYVVCASVVEADVNFTTSSNSVGESQGYAYVYLRKSTTNFATLGEVSFGGTATRNSDYTLPQDRHAFILSLTNPTPVQYTNFGFGTSVARAGTNGFVVGVPSEDPTTNSKRPGSAQLYDWGGRFITTILPPAGVTDALFGASVASVGSDRFVVGAPFFKDAQFKTGRAYLYDQGGSLLATIANPAPNLICCGQQYFGDFAASAGANMFVIGSRGLNGPTDGVVNLYNYNGTLIATIDNQARSAGPVGASYFAVGSPYYWGTTNYEIGIVRVYDLTGGLVLTITNPTPNNYSHFGTAVAGVGSSRLVVGASGFFDGCSHDVGKAFVYDLAGTLLATISSPYGAPPNCANGGSFGFAVAAIGSDRMAVSAPGSAGVTIYNLNGTPFSYIYDYDGRFGRFGHALAALDGNELLVGKPGTYLDSTYAGSVHLYNIPATNNVAFAMPYSKTTTAFSITVVHDGVIEPNETVTVTLTNVRPDTVGSTNVFTITLLDQSVSTPVIGSPTASNVSYTMAMLGGTLVFTGLNPSASERGVYWSTNNGFTPPGQGNKVSEFGAFSPGKFSLPVGGLPIGTSIYFRAFGTNSASPGFGMSAQSLFTTLPMTVTTNTGTPHWWLYQYGFTNNFEAAALADQDGDGLFTWEEYVADTIPTDAGSYFPKLTNFTGSGVWTVIFGRTFTSRVYGVYSRTNLVPESGPWILSGSNITGSGESVIFNVTNLVPQTYFRIGVQLP